MVLAWERRGGARISVLAASASAHMDQPSHVISFNAYEYPYSQLFSFYPGFNCLVLMLSLVFFYVHSCFSASVISFLVSGQLLARSVLVYPAAWNVWESSMAALQYVHFNIPGMLVLTFLLSAEWQAWTSVPMPSGTKLIGFCRWDPFQSNLLCHNALVVSLSPFTWKFAIDTKLGRSDGGCFGLLSAWALHCLSMNLPIYRDQSNSIRRRKQRCAEVEL